MEVNNSHLTMELGHQGHLECFTISIHFMLNMHTAVKLKGLGFIIPKCYNMALSCLTIMALPESCHFQLLCPPQLLQQVILQ